MRIGLVVDTFNLGGAESIVFETARLLKKVGHTPILLHFGSEYVVQFAATQEITSHVIPNHDLYKKGAYLPLFAIKSANFIRKLKLDLLHSHLFGPIIAFSLLSRLIGLPHFGTLHDIYTIEDKPSRIKLIKFAKLLGTHLAAVSRQMLGFYEESANFRSGTISFMPNFAEINRYKNERLAQREQLGLESGDIAVLSVGRIVPLKRFDLLVDAMVLVADDKNCKAFIVGDGPERELLEKQVLAKKLGHKVKFLGERADVEKLLAAADIFTLTSESEGMSKSILEALAAGLPVIATNVGGNPELVLDNKNGYLIDHSASTLSDKLGILVDNSALRQSMGNQSKALLDREYTEDKFIERHLLLYTQRV